MKYLKILIVLLLLSSSFVYAGPWGGGGSSGGTTLTCTTNYPVLGTGQCGSAALGTGAYATIANYAPLASPAITTPWITTGIKDVNGLPIIYLTPTSSAVDYLTVTNAATAGHQVELGVAGSDSAITLNITGKGTGKANIDGVAAGNLTTTNIASSISDSDTTHCPDGNSVYDALAGKAASNASTTVNGQTCTLGSSCTVTASLPSNPSACSSGQYVSDIAADGTLTCGTPAGGAAYIYPETYGAVGNGSTDDTTALTNWLTACTQCALQVGKIYKTSGGFTIATYKHILGNSSTILNTSTTAYVFTINGGAALDISDVNFTQSGTPTAGGVFKVGTAANSLGTLYTNKVLINGLFNGMELYAGYSHRIFNTDFQNCLNAGLYLNGLAGVSSGGAKFIANHFYNNLYGILFDGWDTSEWSDTMMVGNRHNITITGASSYVASQFFTNVSIENGAPQNGEYVIDIQKTGGDIVSNIIFKNLEIYMGTTYTNSGVLVGNAVTDISFDGGRIEGIGTGTSGSTGFNIAGQRVSISNFRSIGSIKGAGISLATTATDISITNNSIINNSTYGVIAAAGATRITLMGNTYTNNTTANKSLSSAVSLMDLDIQTATGTIQTDPDHLLKLSVASGKTTALSMYNYNNADVNFIVGSTNGGTSLSIWSILASASGVFGLYDVINNKTPFKITVNAPTDSFLINANGTLKLAGYTAGTLISDASGNVTVESSPYTIYNSGAIAIGAGKTSTFVICSASCQVTPLVPALGVEFCVQNLPGTTGAITIVNQTNIYYGKADASGYITVSHKYVSGGANTDRICMKGVDATHYMTVTSTGTWTDTSP